MRMAVGGAAHAEVVHVILLWTDDGSLGLGGAQPRMAMPARGIGSRPPNYRVHAQPSQTSSTSDVRKAS